MLLRNEWDAGCRDNGPVLLVYAQDGDSITDDVIGGIGLAGGSGGREENVFQMLGPTELLVQFTCSERGRWVVGRSGIVTFPTEIALHNSGPCCGELITCLLNNRLPAV